jgi:ubiquinol-cytochrome c reductase iron-sulfur subunit
MTEPGGGSGGLKSEAPTQGAGGHAQPSGSPPVNREGRDAGTPFGSRPGAPEGEAGRPVVVRPSRPERRVAAAFGLTALAAAGFALVYALGGQTQLEGVLLALAFASLAYGLGAWANHLMPGGPFVEEHEPFASPSGERAAFAAEYRQDVEAISRRRLLGRALTLAVGALGAALLFPVRSLGPRPGRALFRTPWQAGARAVTADGSPVRAGDLPVGGVLTVFPEGHVDAGDAAALLVRTQEGGGSPGGLLAHSKLCTHAGCPVGLYEPESELLFCPCHQSVFDLRDGARPVAGPATRPLPRLPIELGADGQVRATGDFDGPVGPGFWGRPS